MTAPVYLLQKIARHGASIERLQTELKAGEGELGEHPLLSAIAFDAADYVWAFLASQGYEEAQMSRAQRNHIAQLILENLESQFPKSD